MLMATNLIGFGAGSSVAKRTSLYDAIVIAGLTSNLKLCLDAGDSSSYSGSGQSWLDRSGGGYDFFLGATSSASTDDPTFNGVAGALTSNEFWSFDGGDFFQYDSSNETWMDALHKAGAQFSILGIVNCGGISVGGIVGTCSTQPGMQFNYLGNSNKLQFQVLRSGAPAISKLSDANAALTPGQYAFVGLSVDVVGSTGFMYVNGGYLQVASANTFTATYSSPSTSTANKTMQIFGATSGSPMPSGSKLAVLGIWSSALSKANFDTLYASFKGSYGLT